jgi:hypothetical protein
LETVLDLRDVLSRRERVLGALLILAAFGVWVLMGYLVGPSPRPDNCLSACATSGQVVASSVEAGPGAFRTP